MVHAFCTPNGVVYTKTYTDILPLLLFEINEYEALYPKYQLGEECWIFG